MASEVDNKKKSQIKDYFLQFLMLLLAIFLGAIGENYRQQYTDEVVERNKEKIYTLNETEEHILIQYRIAASKIFKADVFSRMLDAESHKDYKYYIKPLVTDIKLFSTNPSNINEFIFWVSSANGNQSANKAQMLILKEQSLKLISSIQKHLNGSK
jgi:hypothetical protein